MPETCSNRAAFVADVTIPDNTTFAPTATFTKTWRLKNVGTCTWTTAYSVFFVSGNQLGSTSFVNLPSSVAPNGTVDISVGMVAPSTAGNYTGYWRLQNESGAQFGIGSTGNSAFWVKIYVSGSVPPATPGPSPTQIPEQFIGSYFDQIYLRNYSYTWSLLTDSFKNKFNAPAQGGYQGYVDYWNSVQRVQVNSISVLSQDQSTAVVIINALFIDNNGVNTSVYLTYHLIFDSSRATWLFDAP